MEADEVSVVICAKNAEATLERCLRSVKDNNPFEIVVVDGNSADRTVEIARRYTDKVYSDGGRGLGYARQLGVEKANGKYVIHLDADVVLAHDCLAKMLGELKQKNEHGKYAAVNAQLKAVSTRTYWEKAREWRLRRFNAVGDCSYLSPNASISERRLIIDYRFDTAARFGWEVQDLSERLRKAGYKFAVSPSAFCYHHHEATFKALARKHYMWGVATAELFGKHKRGVERLYLLYAFFGFPGAILRATIRGELMTIPYLLVAALCTDAGIIAALLQFALKKLRR